MPERDDLPKDRSDPDLRVRAGLIRYLMLGGCGTDHPDSCRPHPKGVRLTGGWIDGGLDLHGCTSQLNLSLKSCLISEQFDFQDACIGALFMDGSRSEQFVNLHRLKTVNNVHLRSGFFAEKGVDLVGAEIGGALEFGGAKITTSSGNALNVEGAHINSSVFLRAVDIVGRVSFIGTTIGGEVHCNRLTIEGRLSMKASKIKGALVWKRIQSDVQEFDLSGAQVGSLDDDRESWDNVNMVRLGGFGYGQLPNPMSVPLRLLWLQKSVNPPVERVERGMSLLPDDPGSFDPRPYTQLAKVLREDGLDSMAAQILEAREDCQRDAEYSRIKARLRYGEGGDRALIKAGLTYWAKCAFKRLFGYGHAPAKVLIWIGAIWAFGFVLYGTTYQYGQMAPNSDVMLSSRDWMAGVEAYAACATDCMVPLRAWEATPAYQDYETFHPFLYALDLFVPLDALGQENAWAPSKDRGWWGWLGYWARMPIQMSGWIITAMGAAVVTGLVGRKE